MKKLKCIIVVLSICVILTSCASKTSQSIMPYELEWGDSFEQLTKKAGSVTEISKNDAGNFLSNGIISNDYLGLANDALNMRGNYNFQSGETLKSILIVVSLEENESLDDQSFLAGLIDHYAQLTGQEAEESVMGYTWTTESCLIQVSYMSAGIFIIYLEQP